MKNSFGFSYNKLEEKAIEYFNTQTVRHEEIKYLNRAVRKLRENNTALKDVCIHTVRFVYEISFMVYDQDRDDMFHHFSVTAYHGDRI